MTFDHKNSFILSKLGAISLLKGRHSIPNFIKCTTGLLSVSCMQHLSLVMLTSWCQPHTLASSTHAPKGQDSIPRTFISFSNELILQDVAWNQGLDFSAHLPLTSRSLFLWPFFNCPQYMLEVRRPIMSWWVFIQPLCRKALIVLSMCIELCST